MDKDRVISKKKIIFWVIWALVSPLFLMMLIFAFGPVIAYILYMGAGYILVLLVLVIALISGGIGTLLLRGKHQFGEGMALILVPCVVLCLYYAGAYSLSDSRQREKLHETTSHLLEKQQPIKVSGLYVESSPLTYMLGKLLIERQLAWIEGDVSGAQWLFNLAKDKTALIARSSGKKYYRLTFGSDESKDCLDFLDKAWYDGSMRILLRPKTCLRAIFDDNLLSDMRLHLNLQSVDKREAYWEVYRIRSDNPIISIPFWAEAIAKHPDFVDYHSLEMLVGKFLHEKINIDAEGTPYVFALRQVIDSDLEMISLKAAVRLYDMKQRPKEKMYKEQAYESAKELGLPVAFGEHDGTANAAYVVFPKSNEIYRVRDSLRHKLFVDGCCVFDVYSSRFIWLTIVPVSENRPLKITIDPESRPEEIVPSCPIYVSDTKTTAGPEPEFYVIDTKITESELKIIGQYNCSSRFFEQYYEWVVSLDQLPPWVGSRSTPVTIN